MDFSEPIDRALLACGPRWSTLRATEGAGFPSWGRGCHWIGMIRCLHGGGATVVARIVSGHFGSNREHVRRV
jgi:hypothetical protein